MFEKCFWKKILKIIFENFLKVFRKKILIAFLKKFARFLIEFYGILKNVKNWKNFFKNFWWVFAKFGKIFLKIFGIIFKKIIHFSSFQILVYLMPHPPEYHPAHSNKFRIPRN